MSSRILWEIDDALLQYTYLYYTTYVCDDSLMEMHVLCIEEIIVGMFILYVYERYMRDIYYILIDSVSFFFCPECSTWIQVPWKALRRKYELFHFILNMMGTYIPSYKTNMSSQSSFSVLFWILLLRKFENVSHINRNTKKHTFLRWSHNRDKANWIRNMTHGVCKILSLFTLVYAFR